MHEGKGWRHVHFVGDDPSMILPRERAGVHVTVSQSEALVLRGLGIGMLRIPPEAVSGILFAINRSDMWWVSIEIWSSDS